MGTPIVGPPRRPERVRVTDNTPAAIVIELLVGAPWQNPYKEHPA